ncbi:MAG TPA: TetR/AcrR family transcriptional regulator [Candidatus Binataceae bacterium]|jgi:TetR/AcrR family fatty acid metabolism transcriptional regulator|nr:TetR/AcrR family transcriptional regulator [Candidatus Binataceae bacterium]
MTSDSRPISQDKHQDSRDEILKAGIRLFARRGFHETSMSEVARDARVSKALIFWHFKTKEELFLAVLNRLLEPYFIDFAEEVGALDERAQLRKLVQSYLLFVRDNAPSVRFFLGQLLHGEKVPEELAAQVMKLYDGYRELMIDIVRRAQEKNLCSRDLAPEAAAGFMISALNGALIGFLFTGGATDESSGAVTMIEEWLFRDFAQRSTEGGKAVA